MLQILNEIKNNMIKLWSRSKINNQKSRLHLVACNRNQRFAFHVILCYISRHFMSHFTYFIIRITCIAHMCHACRAFRMSRTARISCIAPHIASFYISFHVISSWKFRAYSFMAFRIEERRNSLFNRAPPEWGVLIRRIKTPPEWGIFTNDRGAASSKRFIS